MSKKLSPQKRTRILELRERGSTFAEIARAVGCSLSAAHKVAKAAGRRTAGLGWGRRPSELTRAARRLEDLDSEAHQAQLALVTEALHELLATYDQQNTTAKLVRLDLLTMAEGPAGATLDRGRLLMDGESYEWIDIPEHEEQGS